MKIRSIDPAYDRLKAVVAAVLLLVIVTLLINWKLSLRPAAPEPVSVTPTIAAPAGPVIPPLPDSPVPLTYDPVSRYLYVPSGREVYVLDDNNTWAPVIPAMSDELSLAVSEGTIRPTLGNDGWTLNAPDGTLLYTYNLAAQTWEPTEAARPATASAPTAEATTVSAPTAAPTAVPTAIPTAAPPTATAAPTCKTVPVRLAIGMRARVLNNLNLRSSPGIGYSDNNWLLTNPVGTQVEIVGGPECIPFSIGAYRWWQVKLTDGRTGWSAEGSFTGSGYFLEPVP